MISSFDSWQSLNEALNRGSQVFINQDGTKQRIVWKIQNKQQYMLKMIHAADVIDASGNLTPEGAAAINNFFNTQVSFINTIGSKLDTTFFTTKFIIYAVLTDNSRKQRIQFTIVDRSQYPSLDPKFQYVNTNAMQGVVDQGGALSDVVTDTEDKVQTEDTHEEPEVVDDKTEDEAVGTEETEAELGSKFMYTMRTNGKNYLMEFVGGGAIDANVIGDNHPNGVVSYEGGKVMWNTDSDSAQNATKYTKWISEEVPLYYDMEITNPTDKSFLTKMFTDEAFREEQIRAYEDEYGSSEITAENLKYMLYHLDGSPIFEEAIKDKEVEGTPAADDFSMSKIQG